MTSGDTVDYLLQMLNIIEQLLRSEIRSIQDDIVAVREIAANDSQSSEDQVEMLSAVLASRDRVTREASGLDDAAPISRCIDMLLRR